MPQALCCPGVLARHRAECVNPSLPLRLIAQIQHVQIGSCGFSLIWSMSRASLHLLKISSLLQILISKRWLVAFTVPCSGQIWLSGAAWRNRVWSDHISLTALAPQKCFLMWHRGQQKAIEAFLGWQELCSLLSLMTILVIHLHHYFFHCKMGRFKLLTSHSCWKA